ncbi:MAG: vitamin transporter [Acidobacteriota bacterium]|jgi:vitamin B12 transporter|nr:vitamin transporter [Acidobacteriota bacterium]
MRQILLVAVAAGILGGGVPVVVHAQTPPTPPPPASSANPANPDTAPAQPPAFVEKIVVSTSLSPEPDDLVTSSVTVVDRQEIAARQVTTLADLLATIPGLALVQAGAPGQQTSLFTRGTSSVQTLLLWNGMPLNDPYFGGANWQFVPTDGVSRVEVVRGPASAVYGSNALGGVVQVLTQPGNGAAVRLEGGSHAYKRAGLTGGWDFRQVHLDLAGHARRGDGEIKNDAFDSEDLLARALWTLAPGVSLGVIGRADDSETGIPLSGGTPTPNRHIAWREREVAIPFRFERGDFALDAQASRVAFDNAYRDPGSPSGFTAANTTSEALRGRTVASWQARPDLRLSFGTEVERLQVTDGSNFGPNLSGARQRTWAVFGEVGYSAGPFHGDLGVRRDDNDVYGGQTSLHLGGVVALSAGFRLRASYGEAFRAPALGELFFPGSGNPDLKPETGESYEVGIERQAGGWRFALTGFESRQRNLIDFDFATFKDVNVGRAKSRGIEAEVGFRRGIASVRLDGTYLDAQDRTTGLALLRRPKQSGSLVLALTPRRWTFSLTERVVSERPDIDPVRFTRSTNPGYQRLDLAASYQALPWLAPYARVENAAGRAYAEALGFPAPGRTVIGGVAVTF